MVAVWVVEDPERARRNAWWTAPIPSNATRRASAEGFTPSISFEDDLWEEVTYPAENLELGGD